MAKIPTSKLVPGMRLARPVLNESGLAMIGENVELTEALIEKIQQMSVASVHVHGVSPLLPPKEEMLSQLQARFKNVESMPYMDTLKRLIADHIEGLYEEHGSEDA